MSSTREIAYDLVIKSTFGFYWGLSKEYAAKSHVFPKVLKLWLHFKIIHMSVRNNIVQDVVYSCKDQIAKVVKGLGSSVFAALIK